LLLGTAWLVPLVSFALIVLFGPRMGRAGRCAGYLAMAAIFISCLLSLTALGVWISHHPLATAHGHESAAAEPICGEWYSLGQFGRISLTIGYYIDSLTVAMFAMVTFIASCIHVYSYGYMHEELDDVTDPLAPLSNGQPLVRRGRFHRFYQYLSLFCFSMLGLVISGNIAMVFVFWELVGICSYFLIGFYIERRSASNAANKAFIVNRVGDFGMIVGLMVVCAGMGTFTFGDLRNDAGQVEHAGIFSQVRPESNHHALTVPEGMVRLAARSEIAQMVRSSHDSEAVEKQIQSRVSDWRKQGYGYWLLVIGGLGIFCGCVGKSAQFPLHVWLPDAMEGPTPVSALIHAATMVAAGVYLVGRFYPVFTPEVLLVIAYIGCTTLFIAATIAITATDIKRVLAYSTVSQLGYMMLALGVGGWIAGLFHLFTHAFFKALLFLCSGSVIHATHTNEMPRMGGLLKKMPWTAGTMLVGCLAISGAGIPLVVGLSGYYSKDAILGQLMSFRDHNPAHAWLFYAATAGAAVTAFYMFRLWFMTFVGKPRDEHVYHHAHESPAVMYVPLVILAVMATIAGWKWVGLQSLLEQARPLGTAEGVAGGWLASSLAMPAEHLSHESAIHVPVSWIAFGVAVLGFSLALAFYGLRVIDPEDARRQFSPLHRFLLNKWWFDELYHAMFVRPSLYLSQRVADLDRRGIDGIADGLARGVRLLSTFDDWIDRLFVDGLVNGTAKVIFGIGLWLRNLQTGNLRQYVMFMAVAVVALFVLISLYWNLAFAG
jgi:NADH-quinone oxidoreductase subunit L